MTQETHLKKYLDYLLGEELDKKPIALITGKHYVRAIRFFLDYTKKEPNELTVDDVRAYKGFCVKKYKKNSLFTNYSAINRYCQFIKLRNDDGDIIKIKLPQKRVVNKVPLTQEEIEELFNVSRRNLRDNALLKTLYYGLLRRNELKNLNIEDIDFKDNYLRINHGKGDKSQTINLHPEAIESIQAYLKVRGTSRKGDEKSLFLNRNGWRIGVNDITKTVKRYALVLGLEKRVYPHLFRISGITHMYLNGVGLEDIRRQSRHSDFKVIIGYLQLTPEENKENYLKGFKIGTPPEPKPQPEPQPQEPPKPKKKDSDIAYSQPSDLVKKLAVRLAIGEINQETYNHALHMLKSENKPDNNPIYG